MSTSKKLSDKLGDAAAESLEWTEGVYADDLKPWAAEARALEERVHELEENKRWSKADALLQTNRELTTRAEAAEADLAATERENERLGAALEAAEAEVAALKTQAARMEKYDVILTGERNDLQAEVAALKAQMADQLAAFDKAWVEPKALAAEVARLREDNDSVRKLVLQGDGAYVRVCSERDALREDLNDARNGWESAAAETRRLDAKLEKLENHIKSSRQMLVDAEMLSNHLVCEAIRKACAEHGGDGFALAGRVLAIIDGENDT